MTSSSLATVRPPAAARHLQPAPDPVTEPIRLLTPADVAELAGRSRRWAYDLIASGALHHVAVNGAIRVRVDDWNAYVDSLDGR